MKGRASRHPADVGSGGAGGGDAAAPEQAIAPRAVVLCCTDCGMPFPESFGAAAGDVAVMRCVPSSPSLGMPFPESFGAAAGDVAVMRCFGLPPLLVGAALRAPKKVKQAEQPRAVLHGMVACTAACTQLVLSPVGAEW